MTKGLRVRIEKSMEIPSKISSKSSMRLLPTTLKEVSKWAKDRSSNLNVQQLKLSGLSSADLRETKRPCWQSPRPKALNRSKGNCAKTAMGLEQKGLLFFLGLSHWKGALKRCNMYITCTEFWYLVFKLFAFGLQTPCDRDSQPEVAASVTESEDTKSTWMHKVSDRQMGQ